jgi:hypothetical protein
MDISPNELFNVISYFIEIKMLVEKDPTKYQAPYLMFVDFVIDSYSEEIKSHIYEYCTKFLTKYAKLQSPDSMSPQLSTIINDIYMNSIFDV